MYHSATTKSLKENKTSITSSKWQKSEHWEENKERRESRAGISATRAVPTTAVQMNAWAMGEEGGTWRSLVQFATKYLMGAEELHNRWQTSTADKNRLHHDSGKCHQIKWWWKTWIRKVRIILFDCNSYVMQFLSLLNHNFSIIYVVSLSL